MAGMLWFFIIATLLGLAAIIFLLLFQPPPAYFKEAKMITVNVTPTDMPYISVNEEGSLEGVAKGVVHMDAVVKPRSSDEENDRCLSSTQYFLDLPDGEKWKLPGSRLTEYDRTTETVSYQTVVPFGAKPGKAYFYVVDTYGCGLHDQKIYSPKLEFNILPSESEYGD